MPELSTYRLDKTIAEKLQEPISEKLIHTLDKGGKKLSYISAATAVGLLNSTYGPFWDWEIKDKWLEKAVDKEDYKTKKLIPQNPNVNVLGRLTVHFLDENGERFSVSKDAIGTKSVVGGQDAQKDSYKIAATNALKKAASLFGIGADLYMEDEEWEYFSSGDITELWTAEELLAHREEFSYLERLYGDENIGREVIRDSVEYWSKGKYSSVDRLSPENLTAFVAFIKETLGESDGTGSV